MRLYRLLLRVFPPEFRRRFGDDMTAVFVDRLRAARARGRPAALAFFVRTVGDLVRHGAGERARSRAGSRWPRRESTMGSIWQDVRYGLRTLRRQPVITLVAVATLALGIGANTAVFSVAHALLLRPLPYPASDRLHVIEEVNEARGFSGNVAMPNFDDWRTSVSAIDAAAAWVTTDLNLAAPAGAERVAAGLVTADFFSLVGAMPTSGRVFSDLERTPGRDAVVVLSERARARLYGTDDVTRLAATIDGVPHAIIGTVPAIPGFDAIEVWRPLARSGAATARTNHAYRALVRLKEGIAAGQATSEFNAVAAGLEAAYPDSNDGWRVRLTPLQADLTSELSDPVTLLAGIVGLLLLIACANVAGLLLTRVADRHREFAVRVALGAARRRLVRQVLTESVVLSAAGAVVGLAVAWLALDGLVAAVTSEAGLWTRPALSAPALAFAALVSVVTGVVFGIAPALTTRHGAPQSHLRDGAGATSRRSRRTRSALAFVQLAIASVLLSATGIVAASLVRAVRTDPGFDPRQALTFRLTPPRATHADAAALETFFSSLQARLSAAPEVVAAGATARLPMGGTSTIRTVIRPDEPLPERGQERYALYDVITPGYVAAAGLRLLDGRDFADSDTNGSRPVAIVAESLAGMLWPGARAVGREILTPGDETEPREVVGVVADLKFRGLDRQTLPQYYVPLRQAPQRSLAFVARLRGPNAPDLRLLVAELDSTVPVYDVRMLEDMVRGSVANRRAISVTLALFGSVALGLAAIGLYGVIATGVRERQQEIGIRIAIGASASDVRRLFVRQGLALSAAGILAGSLSAFWVTAWMRELVAGLEPIGPMLLSAVAAVVMLIALIATWVPTRHATRIDPTVALRGE